MTSAPAATILPADWMMRATFRSVRYGKPPLKMLTFDVTVRNPSSEPRWLVVPSTLEEKPFDVSREIKEAEVQVYQLGERPRVRIFRAISGHFWAVKLQPGAVLVVRSLKVDAWWSSLPAEAPMEILLAREIRCAGRELGELSEGDSLSEGGEVEGAVDAGDQRARKFWHPDTGHSAPLTLTIEHSQRMVVALKAPP